VNLSPPLKDDHPLVCDPLQRCASCHLTFAAGQRVLLIPIPEPPPGGHCIEALPAHATCVLKGRETPKGVIARIKDGDGSPYPVELEGGEQATLEECRLVPVPEDNLTLGFVMGGLARAINQVHRLRRAHVDTCPICGPYFALASALHDGGFRGRDHE